MDIGISNTNSTLNNPTITDTPKVNVMVIGDKKSGKTTFIRSFFTLLNKSPETNFLLDSVKIWETKLTSYGEMNSQYNSDYKSDCKTNYIPTHLRFLEMDLDPNVLNHIEKFESFFSNGKNILCLVVRTSVNLEMKKKNQSRVELFFNKLSKYCKFFEGCVVVPNEFVRKSGNNFNYNFGENVEKSYEKISEIKDRGDRGSSLVEYLRLAFPKGILIVINISNIIILLFIFI